jgi:hypothetical protein
MNKTIVLLLLAAMTTAMSLNASQAASFFLGKSPQNPRYCIAGTSTRYVFISPRGWKMSGDSQTRSARFEELSNGSIIQIAFNDDQAQDLTEAFGPRWKEKLKSRFPGALIQEKPAIPTLSTQAVVFDVTWSPTQGVTRLCRLARVKLPAGYLEFTLSSSSPSEFEADGPVFSQVVGSFKKFDPSARVQLPPLLIE